MEKTYKRVQYRTKSKPIKFMSKEFCDKCSKYMMMFYIKSLLRYGNK